MTSSHHPSSEPLRTETEPWAGWHRFEMRRDGDGWSAWAVHDEGFEAELDNHDGELPVIFGELANRVIWEGDDTDDPPIL